MRKKRRGMGRGLSLLLCGMLVFASPLQALADAGTAEEVTAETLTPTDTGENAALENQLAAANALAGNADAAAPAADAPAENAETWESGTTDTAVPEAAAAPAAEDQTVEAPKDTEAAAPAANAAENITEEAANAETASDTEAALNENEAKADPASVSENAPAAYTGAQNLEAVTADGVRVQVSFEAGTFGEKELPELRVQDLSDADALSAAEKALPDEEIAGAKSVDISFYVNGTEVQPLDGQNVSVQIALPESVNPQGEPGEYNLIHEHEGTTEVVDTAKVTDTEAEFRTDSFSVFTITWLYSLYHTTTLDVTCVDENNVGLADVKVPAHLLLNSNAAQALNDRNKAIEISGYHFEKATATTDNKTYENVTSINAVYGSSNWTYTLVSNGGNQTVEGEGNIKLTLVYEKIDKDITIRFDKNGGSDTSPAVMTGKSGDSITLPSYNGTRRGYEFVGWTDTANLEGDSSYHQIYDVNSSYTIPNNDTTLYAAWSNGSGITRSDFYIRLNGTIPVEPSYYPSTQYTRGININNNVKRKHWIVDTATRSIDGSNARNTVTDNLNSLPTAAQLSDVINAKQNDTGFGTKVVNNEVVVDRITDSEKNSAGHNVRIGDELYVHWYVQKLQSTGIGSNTTALTWHIDGTLLVKSRVTINYVKNTNDVVNNMPLGYQTPPNTNVVIGASGSPNGTVLSPTRVGWTFNGWNTKSDGTGTSYNSEDAYILAEDTTLYAQWSQTLTSITGTKTWVDGGKIHNNEEDVQLKLTRTSTAVASPETVEIEDPIKLTWSGNRYTFTNLPAYDTSGNPYTYDVKEEEKDGYQISYDGRNITNTLVGTTTVSGSKTWQDGGETIAHNNAIEVTLVLQRKSAKSGSDWETVADKQPTWNGNDFSYSDLAKYDSEGYEYEYRVNEINVRAGYISSREVNSNNFTNTRSAKLEEISGMKTWRDGGKTHNNANEVTLTLTRTSSNQTTSERVSATPEWNGNVYRFKNLDRYDAQGAEYTYAVTEQPINGYDISYDPNNRFNIINTITGTITVSGTKTWIDGGRQHDNAKDVPLRLTRFTEQNTTPVEVNDVTPTWNGNRYTYNNLPEYDNEGNKYTYEIAEGVVSGYKSDISGFNLTNTITGTTTVSGTKTWKDGNDQITHDNATEVTLVLTRRSNGESGFETVNGVTPTWSGNTYTFVNLPKYDPQTGREYEYQVNEINVQKGYESTRDGFDFTNTKTGNVEVRGEKIWLDEGVPHNNEEEVKLTLTRKSTAEGSQTETVDAVPEWQENTYVFENLPARDGDGHKYEYSVSEAPVRGYVSTKVNNNFINTRTGTMNFSGTKTWLDGGEEHDNAKEVKLTLTRSSENHTTPETVETDNDVTLTWDGNTYTYHNLPEFDEQGKRYEYRIDEAEVPGYVTTVKDHDLINTRTGKTEVSGTKTWKDGTDKVHHEYVGEVTLLLSRRSSAPNSGWENLTTEEPVWHNATENSAEYTFHNLARYDDQGYEYEYRVEEINVPEGYSSSRDGNDFTNVKTGKTEISGIKTWQDDGRYHDNAAEVRLTLTRKSTADGSKEEKVEATPTWDGNAYRFTNLESKDGEGNDYIYTVSEAEVKGYKSSQHGTDFTNTITGTTSFSGTKKWVDGGRNHDNSSEVKLTLTRTSETYQEPETVNVEGAITLTWNGSQYTYSNLPKYDDQGKEYDYHIYESPVEGYESDVDGHDVINTITGTTDISGTKTWKDGDQSENHNNEEEVTLVLTRQSAGNKSVWENVENAEPTWDGSTYTFSNLAGFDEEGYEYTYHVSEINIPEGYTSSRQGNDFTNTRTGTTEISGVKVWRDGGLPHNNAEEVNLTLTRTSAGSAEAEKVDAVPVWEENTYIFSNLDSHDKAGNPYTYHVSEAKVEGYTTTQQGNNLFNTITGTTTVSGTKTWRDGGKKHNNEQEVKLILTRTSEKYTEPETVKVNDPITLTWNDERYTFNHLPKYDDEGNLYTYSVGEENVEGYETAIDGYNLTNTITGVTEVTGTKKWVDGGRQHDNAKEVTLLLSRESKKKGAAPEIVENEKPTWKDNTYTFSHLPKYDAEGYEYTYGVSEINVEDGYISSRKGNDFTNVYNKDKKEIVGYKEWIDGGRTHDNAKEVKLTLKRKVILENQGEVEETLNVKPEWSKDDLHENVYKFSNLDRYDGNGNEYSYWVSEAKVDGYVTEQDGDNFTNVIENINAKTDVTGTKTWVDDGRSHDNAAEVTLELIQESKKAGSAETVLKDAEPVWNGSTYTYKDLPKYDNEGYEYTYRIREINVPEGYKAKVSVNGRDITNTKEGPLNPEDPTPKPPVIPSDDKEKYTVTYNDGVDDEEIFKDQVYEAENGDKTPEFKGTPTRPGYIFKGWTPEVADTVTGNVIYKAVWEEANPVPSKDNGKATDNGTGSRSPMKRRDKYNGTSDGSTSGKKSSIRSTGNVKTGDTTEFAFYIAAMLGAAVVLAGLLWTRKRKSE